VPMTLSVDNKGAKELVSNGSVGGWTRHMDVQGHFLNRLKMQTLFECSGSVHMTTALTC
jgi:hypothetical protein